MEARIKMNHNYYIERLIRNREIFLNLLAGVSKEAVLWKPNPSKWCMLEVLCHLVDEEREDFRVLLKKSFENTETPVVPVQPESWVKERNYIKQDCDKKLKKFLHERDKSISWLQSLSSPGWRNTIMHPTAGRMSAEKILVNWVAHDYLHIRQITRLKYQFMQTNSGMDLSYAGKW